MENFFTLWLLEAYLSCEGPQWGDCWWNTQCVSDAGVSHARARELPELALSYTQRAQFILSLSTMCVWSKDSPSIAVHSGHLNFLRGVTYMEGRHIHFYLFFVHFVLLKFRLMSVCQKLPISPHHMSLCQRHSIYNFPSKQQLCKCKLFIFQETHHKTMHMHKDRKSQRKITEKKHRRYTEDIEKWDY